MLETVLSFISSHLSPFGFLLLPSLAIHVHELFWLCLQALAQELHFSAYLGLPVFMMSMNGPHKANLARVLLNHIQSGHHTTNVRHGTACRISARASHRIDPMNRVTPGAHFL